MFVAPLSSDHREFSCYKSFFLLLIYHLTALTLIFIDNLENYSLSIWKGRSAGRQRSISLALYIVLDYGAQTACMSQIVSIMVDYSTPGLHSMDTHPKNRDPLFSGYWHSVNLWAAGRRRPTGGTRSGRRHGRRSGRVPTAGRRLPAVGINPTYIMTSGGILDLIHTTASTVTFRATQIRFHVTPPPLLIEPTTETAEVTRVVSALRAGLQDKHWGV